MVANHNIWPDFVTGPAMPRISSRIKPKAIKFIKGVVLALLCDQ